MPAKDPWHSLKQLHTKQGGQEAIQMPASIINYLQAMPELAGLCVQTSAVFTSESGIVLGPSQSKKIRKTKDELLVFTTPRLTAGVSTAGLPTAQQLWEERSHRPTATAPGRLPSTAGAAAGV